MAQQLTWTGASLVAAGGAAGCLARYIASTAMHAVTGDTFPFGTLLVNAVGCALAGILIAWPGPERHLAEGVRLALMVGVLGGLTTFSAFGAETFALLRDGRAPAAAVNIALNLVVALAALIGAWWLTRALR